MLLTEYLNTVVPAICEGGNLLELRCTCTPLIPVAVCFSSQPDEDAQL